MAQNLGGGVADHIEIGGVQQQIAYEYYVTGVTWVAQVNADGVSSRTLIRPLAKNALVRRFTVHVSAARADGTTLDNAGQVRLQTEASGTKIIVVDFGMLRTVSGVGLVTGTTSSTIKICSLRAFRGDGFADTDLYFEDCVEVGPPFNRSAEDNTFETRTDRVRLKLKTTASLTTIASKVWLQFPDLPSDLDIRVNGGAPAWSAPGVAQPNTRGWDANTHQEVDLTAALTALTGNSRDATALDATIVLASRIPGLLALEPGTIDVAYLARIPFGEAEDTTLVLDQEGERDIVLALPAWVKTVQEVRFTVTATVPSERILEPVGPSRALIVGGSGAAYDLLLDVDHAGAARLDAATPFTELTAVRLPLRAGVDGAEVRAVLYEGTLDGPTRAAPGGTSTPVDLAPAAADADDVWTSFPLPNPVKLQPAITYWVVVVVGRGGASWSLGRFDGMPAVPIRRGSPVGPWHTLPNVTLDGASLGARIRAVGKAPASAPVAPLTVSVVGHENSHTDVTPTPKGVAATWVAPGTVVGVVHPAVTPEGPASAPTLTLRLTARMTGTVKLSAVDVVATK